jgi:hypothetical protein
MPGAQRLRSHELGGGPRGTAVSSFGMHQSLNRDLGLSHACRSRVEGLFPAQEQPPQQSALGLGQQVAPGAGGRSLSVHRPFVLGAQDAELLLQKVGQ